MFVKKITLKGVGKITIEHRGWIFACKYVRFMWILYVCETRQNITVIMMIILI